MPKARRFEVQRQSSRGRDGAFDQSLSLSTLRFFREDQGRFQPLRLRPQPCPVRPRREGVIEFIDGHPTPRIDPALAGREEASRCIDGPWIPA